MNVAGKQVVVTGGFDDMRSKQIRFLEEAAKFGGLTVLLWNDESLRRITGNAPKFPESERQYLLRSIRFVSQVRLVDGSADLQKVFQGDSLKPDVWVLDASHTMAANDFCKTQGIEQRVLQDNDLHGFPEHQLEPSPAGRKKVVVTGCYDWFHSGHVRFFEEVSEYGDLHVVVGNDANVRMLKGPRNPMHSQDERHYVVGAVRFVKQAWISTGESWLDAEPEIERIRPDIYAVNEDGDRGGKREFCERRGIEYLVLKRAPAPGLPKRSSTDLRGY